MAGTKGLRSDLAIMEKSVRVIAKEPRLSAPPAGALGERDSRPTRAPEN